MPSYIDVVIDTDPQDIMDDFVTFMQTVVPGWEPSPGQLDTWFMQMTAPAAADTRDIASAVPKSIFRWFGANLVNLPPIDDTFATVTSKWTMQDNAGYTIPAGTQVSISKSGTDVYGFETVVDVIIPPGSTLATGVQLVAVEPGSASSGLGTVNAAVQLVDPLTFVTTVTQDTATTGGLDAEDDDTYLTRLAGWQQLAAPRPILPPDFAVFARNIPGVARATALDGYNPIHNLLTANEASVETDATNWSNNANATPAQTAAQAADGTKSLQLTAIAAGDMSSITNTSKTVTPGDTITILASARTAVTARNVKVGISWRDAADAFISSVFSPAGTNDSTTAWTPLSLTAVAPAGAVKARVYVFVVGAALGEVHYFDKMSMRRGAGTDWVPGGTGETGQPRTISVAAIDAAGAALDAPHKASVLADLQARREVNFSIFVLDPTLNIIDITYQVKALSGYDLPTLVTSINAALAAYLSPAVWGSLGGDASAWVNQTIVRYLEIAQVINQVPGVDYITTTAGNLDLQIAQHGSALTRSDVALGGVAALPTTVGGTLTGTAT